MNNIPVSVSATYDSATGTLSVNPETIPLQSLSNPYSVIISLTNPDPAKFTGLSWNGEAPPGMTANELTVNDSTITIIIRNTNIGQNSVSYGFTIDATDGQTFAKKDPTIINEGTGFMASPREKAA